MPTARSIETGRISKILAFRGIERHADRRGACRRHHRDRRPALRARSPILSATRRSPSRCRPSRSIRRRVTMSFIVNDSPYAGTEGDKVTSRVIRDRLFKEAEGNVALKIEEASDKDSFFVSGRGELQLARSDRNNAPRRLRAGRFASARRHAQGRSNGRDARADRRSRHRRR